MSIRDHIGHIAKIKDYFLLYHFNQIKTPNESEQGQKHNKNCKEGKKLKVIVTKRKFTLLNMETDRKIVVKWADAMLNTKDHKNYKK